MRLLFSPCTSVLSEQAHRAGETQSQTQAESPEEATRRQVLLSKPLQPRRTNNFPSKTCLWFSLLKLTMCLHKSTCVRSPNTHPTICTHPAGFFNNQSHQCSSLHALLLRCAPTQVTLSCWIHCGMGPDSGGCCFTWPPRVPLLSGLSFSVHKQDSRTILHCTFSLSPAQLSFKWGQKNGRKYQLLHYKETDWEFSEWCRDPPGLQWDPEWMTPKAAWQKHNFYVQSEGGGWAASTVTCQQLPQILSGWKIRAEKSPQVIALEEADQIRMILQDKGQPEPLHRWPTRPQGRQMWPNIFMPRDHSPMTSTLPRTSISSSSQPFNRRWQGDLPSPSGDKFTLTVTETRAQ